MTADLDLVIARWTVAVGGQNALVDTLFKLVNNYASLKIMPIAALLVGTFAALDTLEKRAALCLRAIVSSGLALAASRLSSR